VKRDNPNILKPTIMKNLIFNLLILFSLHATKVVANEITAEQVIAAIVEDDFDFITNVIKTRQINPNELFNGKTLLIIAVEDDNAEMINHLVRLGARLSTVGADGYRPMEIAKMQQKIHAQAELIVITS
jgi:hypothetical protein